MDNMVTKYFYEPHAVNATPRNVPAFIVVFLFLILLVLFGWKAGELERNNSSFTRSPASFVSPIPQ